MKRLVVCFAAFALAIAGASAKTYSLTLFQPSVLNGTELKPGDYKLDVNGDKIAIRGHKQKVEANVQVVTGDQKYPSTSVRYSNGSGKYQIQEIRIGGTKTKVVVN
ncbi:MAG: hypothetical protein ACE15B_02580 [Bryobacteraceae bacterium]